MKPLATNPRTMRRSGIREIVDLAVKIPDVIRLDLGEPNFPTPPHVCEAAHKAARDGFTKYTGPAGLLSLREAIAEKLARVNGLAASPENIVVTNGGTSGLMTACMALLEPGDEMLLPDPGWPNWEMMVLATGARPVRYAAGAASGFLPDPAAMARLVTPRTKALLINTPANPTGAVMPPALVAALVEFARAHDLWVISDECYDEFAFDGVHASAAAFDTDGRVISVFSCSKTYAMTGWRVGYALVPETARAVVAKMNEPVIGSVCAIAQKAAEAAFRGPQDCVAEMRAFYRARRDQAHAVLAAAGVAASRPEGAFFAMIDVSAAATDTYAFAKELLRAEAVSVAPGETFGPSGAGLVRVSLATVPERLDEGLRRILRTVARARAAA